jgi:hypothetical protein
MKKLKGYDTHFIKISGNDFRAIDESNKKKNFWR